MKPPVGILNDSSSLDLSSSNKIDVLTSYSMMCTMLWYRTLTSDKCVIMTVAAAHLLSGFDKYDVCKNCSFIDNYQM